MTSPKQRKKMLEKEKDGNCEITLNFGLLILTICREEADWG